MAIPVITLPNKKQWKKQCDHQHPTPKSWHCVLEYGHLGVHQIETKCSCPWDENHIRCPVCIDWKERQERQERQYKAAISRDGIDDESGASAKQKTDFRIPIPNGLHAAPDRATTPAVAPARPTVKPWYVACADEYRDLRERKADLLAQARQLAGKHYTPPGKPAPLNPVPAPLVGGFLTMGKIGTTPNPFVRPNPKCRRRRRVTLRGLWAAAKDVYASWAMLTVCCAFAYFGNHAGMVDFAIAVAASLAIDGAGSWYFEKWRQREGA